MLTVQMLHRIRDAIDDKTNSYTCYAIYQGLDYQCPGAAYCKYYHEEDIIQQLKLLQSEICRPLNYGILFNDNVHQRFQAQFFTLSAELSAYYMRFE